jgi:hypothetical protein
VPQKNEKENAMKKTTKSTIDELGRQIERCLDELRRLGHRNLPRRRVVQARYAALGQQMRKQFNA